MKLADIADALSGYVIGDPNLDVRRVVHPADATGQSDLGLALSTEAAGELAESGASAFVVSQDDAATRPGASLIVYAGPERAATAILTALFDVGSAFGPGVHPAASIAETAELGDGVSVGAGSAIGPESKIGANTHILANVTVGAGVSLGSDCTLHPGAVIGDRVEVGDRVMIHANAVIGSDGFSYLPAGPAEKGGSGEAVPRRIHSLGTVIIEDDVEIGAATTIDRATLRATRIGRGTKIDNQVQIAHNVTIGEGCLICGKSGLAGSVKLGNRVIIAASAGVADHITIGDDAVIMAAAGVASNIKSGEQVVGLPAVARATFYQRYSNVARLSRIFRKFNALTARVSALEEAAQSDGRADRSDMSGGNDE